MAIYDPSGSIVGACVTRRILWAWVLTIPGAAFIGAGLFHTLQPVLP